MLQIEKALNELKQSLEIMAEHVLAMVQLVDAGIQDEKPNALEKLRKRDRQLNEMEKEMDAKCVELLALVNPLGSDLRFVISVLKLDADIERIGDECKSIALYLHKEGDSFPKELKKISEKVVDILSDAFKSLINLDIQKAKSVIKSDDAINKLAHKIIENKKRSLHISFAAKSFERIGDHATNIAEKIIYISEGIDVRHQKKIKL